jgi:hypothetical protein
MRKEWGLVAVFLLQVAVGGVTAQLPFSAGNSLAGINTLSRHHADAFAFTGNAAAVNTANTMGGILAERKYEMKEGGDYLAALSVPLGEGGMGFSLRSSGASGFNESEARLSYGRKLAGPLGAGAEIHYVGISMDGYGKVSVPGFGLGLLFRVSETVNAGIFTRDPVGRGFGKDRLEMLTAVYGLGIGFEPSDQFLFTANLLKEEGRPAGGRLAFQYLPSPNFRLRGGVEFQRRTVLFGAGWQKKSGRVITVVDLQAGWHLLLGLSGALQVQFLIPKKER